MTTGADTAQRVRRVLQAAASDAPAPQKLALLLADGLGDLPLPGHGRTLDRWRVLTAVAEHDLSLAKLYEGHTDALAILAELQSNPASPLPPGGSWGVWAAEAPGGRATIAAQDGGTVVLAGGKCWCSGAASASHALLTAWSPDGRGPQLVRIAVQQPGVRVDATQWQAVGMAGSASLDVQFHQARGTLVGNPGQYLQRPGFWHGGAGVAACWHGGAVAIAAALRRAVQAAPAASRSPLRLVALGKVDLALARSAALLREAAAWIDRHPQHDAAALALRVRLAAEDCARTVLDEAGRALGAGPFCRDAAFARAAADLPVFIRQSHAERDFAALAERLLVPPADGDAAAPAGGWQL